MHKYPVYKHNGKLYSEEYWSSSDFEKSENKRKYAGDIDDLVTILEEEGTITIETITYYKVADGDEYKDDPTELFRDCGDELGVERIA